MTARIDGTAWTAIAVDTATLSAIRTLTIGGADLSASGAARAVLVTVFNAAVGTFQVASGGAAGQVTITPNVWRANRSEGGSGSVTITSLTATSVVGTFTFTAPPVASSGAAGNKVVTEGAFNVTF